MYTFNKTRSPIGLPSGRAGINLPLCAGTWFWFLAATVLAIAPWHYLYEDGTTSLLECLGYLLPVLACFIIPSRLHRITLANWWMWLVAGLFLAGYFLKILFFALLLNGNTLLESFNPEWQHILVTDLSVAYTHAAFAFLVFALALQLLPSPQAVSLVVARPDPRRLRISFIALAAISALTIGLRTWLGIGIMGVETERLPFFLDTIVFRTQAMLIPAGALILIGAYDSLGDTRGYILSSLFLFVHLLALAVISASKAGAFYFLLYLVGYWLLSQRLTPSRIKLMVVLTVVGLLYFIIGLQIRIARLEGSGIEEAFAQLLAFDKEAMTIRLQESLAAIFLRIIGGDSLTLTLMYLQDSQAAPTWAQLSSLGLRDYFTYNVMGVQVPEDFRSPGFIAAFLLVGGLPALLALLPFTLFLWDSLWRSLQRNGMFLGFFSFSAAFLFQILMEGCFLWTDMVVFAGCVLLALLLCRWLAIVGANNGIMEGR